ncbi:hypothetical protein HYX13_00760 [Candidatus Woesearchaeota archaeon]|nr:hypothetical protein [Candidatus Woesearchaeota archaeon]
MPHLKLTPTQKQMLYALGKFYEALNQPLVEKPLQLRTSKKKFIEVLLNSGIFAKKERAVYLNLETLEKKKNCLSYESHLIKMTEKGLLELQKIEKETQKLIALKNSFLNKKPLKKDLQTIIK